MTRAAAALLAALLLAGCGGDDDEPTSAPERKAASPDQLAERWWKWAVERPAREGPIADRTGRRCAEGQPSDVFFLAGTFGGRARRTCAVPGDTPLYVPVVNRVCDVAGDADAALEDCARGFRDAKVSLEVDGQDVPVEFGETEPFTLNADPDSGFGPSGEVVAVAHHAVLDPLESGEHTVRFRGRAGDGFALDVRYVLRVR